MCQHGLSNHCRQADASSASPGATAASRTSWPCPSAISTSCRTRSAIEQAVFVEPLAAAYQVIKQCPIEKRTRVSVVGSGRLGLLVAQVLRTTGCKLDVVGRNEHTLGFCEKKGIQTVPVSDLVPKADRDVVVDCSGSPEGLETAMKLVRPRGTLVLKSTCAAGSQLNLAPLVVNEITLLGSRCGPFPDAIGALARRDIDVESMISRQLPLARGTEAFEMAADPRHIKILLQDQGVDLVGSGSLSDDRTILRRFESAVLLVSEGGPRPRPCGDHTSRRTTPPIAASAARRRRTGENACARFWACRSTR